MTQHVKRAALRDLGAKTAEVLCEVGMVLPKDWYGESKLKLIEMEATICMVAIEIFAILPLSMWNLLGLLRLLGMVFLGSLSWGHFKHSITVASGYPCS